jgi:hypothetical protein
VATAARRKTASSRQRALNRRAIRQLRSVSEDFSGTTLAKEARALERALASRNPRKTTTQRRAQAFAEAAAKYSKAGRPSPSLGTPSWGPPISIMIPPGRVLKRMKKKVSAAKATKKTATPGIAKRQTRDANRRYTKGVFQCGDESTSVANRVLGRFARRCLRSA